MKWGTKEWFDAQFRQVKKSGVDGWSIGSRGSQAVRMKQVVGFTRTYCQSFVRGLDIGCGIGLLSKKILAEFEVEFFYGTDIAFDAVQYAAGKLEDAHFLQSALPLLPFKDGAFDGIFALEVIYYLDKAKRQQALEEIHRVLKPGGTLCLSGALGSEEQYFSENTLFESLDFGYDVVDVFYHRASFYYIIENQFMRMIRLAEQCQDVYKSQKAVYGINNNLIRCLLSNRRFCAISLPLFKIWAAISRHCLKYQFPVVLANILGKILFSEKSKSGIVLVCRKK